MVGPPLSSSKSADKGFNENSHDDLMKLMKCWENVMEILQRDECRISKGTGIPKTTRNNIGVTMIVKLLWLIISAKLTNCEFESLKADNIQVTTETWYHPYVRFTTDIHPVIEGDVFVLQCSADSYPPTSLTYIKKDNNNAILKSCDTFQCSIHLNASRHIGGNYTCIAENEVGRQQLIITVRVLYSPEINVYQRNYTLQCDVRGEPNNSSFVSWKHYSEQGEFLRSLNGSELLVLNSSNTRYMLNGIYQCEATNGILNLDGYLVNSGKKTVQFVGIPEILPNTRIIQYGLFNESTLITVFVYSILPITVTNVYTTEFQKLETGQIYTNHDNFTINVFQKKVLVSGYRVMLQIDRVEKKGLTSYMFEIGNERGPTNYTIHLEVQGDNTVCKLVTFTMVGISIGSGLLGAFVAACICFCHKLFKNTIETSSNMNTYTIPQYDEIDMDASELHEFFEDIESTDQITGPNVEYQEIGGSIFEGQLQNRENRDNVNSVEGLGDYLEPISSGISRCTSGEIKPEGIDKENV